MQKISIKPTWTIQSLGEPPLPPRLLDLLVQVQAHGSLLAAAQQMGLSYRHAWDLIRQGESQFKAALLHMERGKGSKLSLLGEKLVWADHRIVARLTPVLDSLASELAAEIHKVLSGEAAVLRIHASHGYAVEALVERLDQAGLRIEHKYCDSSAAAAALRDGDCDAAGLHIPMGVLQEAALQHYSNWFAGEDLCLIDVATRRQGLMVPAGNPKKIYEVADLLKPDVRFINRQIGSGTRLLLESLLSIAAVQRERIAGFEHGEFTHAAVAAYVASGMADVGFGLEPAARQFHLDFIPLANERYFLLCQRAMLDSPAMTQVVAALRDPALRQLLDRLPGYDASGAGQVFSLLDAYPMLAPSSAPTATGTQA
ncbi:LysR family transcriptional regulator [Paucibacter sp. KBW04]|uniref:helix-turn-helix transcriptional regulator n=1 Tax=Paucibacter sp. KBW04 TaxID=2153361 RepID=UPI000F572969|nr:substrate-binding domain-containing protein [Paucibacter sp. KBW04]RQO61299.1 LysR family transcriptional regulator [Paucibacter sp. KBW04]